MEQTHLALRRFNRFFTQYAGALEASFLGSGLNLTEARLLFEIAQAEPVVARQMQDVLDMDAAHMSRLLARFAERGWITRVRAEHDGRARRIALTTEGRAMFARIDARQRAQVEERLDGLNALQQADLRQAMAQIELLLMPKDDMALTIRPFAVGDLGRLAARQSQLYAADFDWGSGLESIEYETILNFLRHLKPGREQCWIAELHGVMAGSIMVTDEGNGGARLRLLYVEAFARRRSIGETLVDTCIEFAREVGFTTMTLWTHTVLENARRLYAKKGFVLARRETHHHFGSPVEGEIWKRDL